MWLKEISSYKRIVSFLIKKTLFSWRNLKFFIWMFEHFYFLCCTFLFLCLCILRYFSWCTYNFVFYLCIINCRVVYLISFSIISHSHRTGHLVACQWSLCDKTFLSVKLFPWMDLFFFFFFFFNASFCLFDCNGVFLRHVGSSSLTRDWTQAPCIGSLES